MTDITLKQGDTAPNIVRTLSIGSTPIDLTNAAEVTFSAFDKYENEILSDNLSGNVAIESVSPGRVSYNIQAGDFEDVGEYDIEFTVEFTDGEVISYPNDGYVELEVFE